MKFMVVYESMFGNTARAARAVAAGLAEYGEVVLRDAAEAPSAVDPEVALVVAGGPTHAFTMTRPQTRADAVRQGASQGNTATGLREWLSTLRRSDSGQLVATFDTRVGKVRHLPGSAARSAARVARKHGYVLTAPPETFFVHDVAGPLLDGEADRAAAWGRNLAMAAERRAASSSGP